MKNPGDADLEIQTVASENTDDAKVIHENLSAFIAADVGAANRQPVTITVRPKSGAKIIGGLRGYSHWNWLYISHLWVSEEFRSRKIGQQLVAAAIQESRSRNLTGIYVDTFSDQARAFYLKNGFTEVGMIADFPPGKARHFFSLKLSVGP